MARIFFKRLFFLIEVPFVFYFIISQNLNALPIADKTFVNSWSKKVF